MRTSLIITALLAISTILFTNSCSMFCKKGNGEIITETRKLNEFDEMK
jgi:hypothetical protein